MASVKNHRHDIVYVSNAKNLKNALARSWRFGAMDQKRQQPQATVMSNITEIIINLTVVVWACRPRPLS